MLAMKKTFSYINRYNDKKTIDIIQYLCDTFKDTIDINIQNNSGNTVLMHAIRFKKIYEFANYSKRILESCNITSVKAVEYLCDTFKDRIDINKQDNDGKTALILAVQHSNNAKIIQCLCDILIDI